MKSGTQIFLAVFIYFADKPITLFAKKVVVGSVFTLGRRTQKFFSWKWRNPHLLTSRRKFLRRDFGLSTIIFFLSVANKASAAAMAVHVLPDPRPW